MVSNQDIIDLFSDDEAYAAIRNLIILLDHLGIDKDTENLPASDIRKAFIAKYKKNKI